MDRELVGFAAGELTDAVMNAITGRRIRFGELIPGTTAEQSRWFWAGVCEGKARAGQVMEEAGDRLEHEDDAQVKKSYALENGEEAAAPVDGTQVAGCRI